MTKVPPNFNQFLLGGGKNMILLKHERKVGSSGFYDSIKAIFIRDCATTHKGDGVKLTKHYELMLAETILINHVLKANGHVDKVNYQCAIDVLKRKYGLTHCDVKQLFLIANDPQEQKPSLRECASLIRNQYGQEKLPALLEGLWLVASANGKVAAPGRSSITSIAHAIGVSDKQNRSAQQCAFRRSRIMQTAPFHSHQSACR